MALMPGDWPMAQEVHTAFFSYCREDSEFALKLAADLKSAGAHVWIDQLDIEPGAPWDRAVEDALTSSPRMLVVLSPVSVNSDNVRDEVSFALSRQKRVIPVLYRDCDVPFRLARLQHVDFRPDYGRALRILLRALGVEEPAPPPAAKVVPESAVPTVQPAADQQPQQLEEERKLAAEPAEVEEARKLAAEKARLEQQERERKEAEATASQERLRRDQRAAEQARLEEEARRAEERARLAQQEQERLAEIRTRQEQLRREQQESVERERLDLRLLEREQQEREAAEKALLQEQRRRAEAQDAGLEQPPKAGPSLRVPAPPGEQAPTKAFNFASPKYLAGAAILLLLIGLIAFVATRRGNPQKAQEGSVNENKPAETAAAQQPQSQTANEKTPTDTAGTKTGPATSGENVAKQDQTQAKTQSSSNPATDLAQAKSLAHSPAADFSSSTPGGGTPAATKTATNIASDSPVKVSQGVSKGMLTHQVKPVYPPLARHSRVQGTVLLAVVIAKDGTIKSINALDGHPLLIPAAIDAVKQWRYKPYKLNGKPAEVDTTVAVNFVLTN